MGLTQHEISCICAYAVELLWNITMDPGSLKNLPVLFLDMSQSLWLRISLLPASLPAVHYNVPEPSVIIFASFIFIF